MRNELNYILLEAKAERLMNEMDSKLGVRRPYQIGLGDYFEMFGAYLFIRDCERICNLLCAMRSA